MPRIVDGKPTKNPRYLQNRPDLEDPRSLYLAQLGARLFRRLPLDAPVLKPVNSVLAGRRNNPPDEAAGIRALAVYNPIHYQELPELFMDFICLPHREKPVHHRCRQRRRAHQGPVQRAPAHPRRERRARLVSPHRTTTASPAPPATSDGNTASITTSACSFPEIWSRMFIPEREPDYLISNGYLEKLEDFEHDGKLIEASRLGYRITEKFVSTFFGRMFSAADTVFSEDMLRPELQSMDDFIDGLDNIIETQRRVALNYFEDGSIDVACPPLKALLHIMAYGEFEGKSITDPAIRALFTREALIASDWYQARLDAKAGIDQALWKRHLAYLETFLTQAELSERNQAPQNPRAHRQGEIHARTRQLARLPGKPCRHDRRGSGAGLTGDFRVNPRQSASIRVNPRQSVQAVARCLVQTRLRRALALGPRTA